jgi:serine/threonine protein kinase
LMTPVFTPYYVSGEILEAARVHRAKKTGALPSSHVFAYDKSCDIWSLGVILYIVLSGYPPFQSELPGAVLSEKMKKNIREGHYVFHPKYWSHISNEAKDLVSSMLSPSPGTRCTAEDIMANPWVVGDNVKDTQLQTPTAMMVDPEHMAASVQQWDEELTNMRREETQLKPLTIANNRLMQKRLAAGSAPQGSSSGCGDKPTANLPPCRPAALGHSVAPLFAAAATPIAAATGGSPPDVSPQDVVQGIGSLHVGGAEDRVAQAGCTKMANV